MKAASQDRVTLAAFAAALGDPALPPPPGLTSWNGSGVERRFAIYRNNVAVSFIDALAAAFPVTQALVGEAFFRAMARRFIAGEPPRSRLVVDHGEGFPAFIDGFEPAAAVPYLGDVARLERARIRAYHAADAAPLGADDWAALAPEAALTARLALHPSATAIASRHAIVSVWAAHRGEVDLGAVDPSLPEEALICRPRLEVEVRRLPPGGAEFLTRLRAGASIVAATEAMFAEGVSIDIPALIGTLVESGVVTGFITDGHGAGGDDERV